MTSKMCSQIKTFRNAFLVTWLTYFFTHTHTHRPKPTYQLIEHWTWLLGLWLASPSRAKFYFTIKNPSSSCQIFRRAREESEPAQPS